MLRITIYSLFIFGFLIINVQGFAQHSTNQEDIQNKKQSVNIKNELSSDSIELLSHIREATLKFKNIQVANDEGYLPFGPDMPNMGEHFVNPSLAVSRELNKFRPSVLTYLRVDNEMVLTGVAYTIPVLADEYAPAPPFSEAQWHFHSGNLLEEAHGLHNHSMHNEHSDKVRLGMLHAWIWTDNPDGMFAADNWSLNLLRLGIDPSYELHPSASKALFLLYSGVDYYTRFVEMASTPNADNLNTIHGIIKLTRSKVAPVASRIQNQGYILAEDEKRLIEIWKVMWGEINIVSDTQTWNNLIKYLSYQDTMNLHRKMHR